MYLWHQCWYLSFVLKKYLIYSIILTLNTWGKDFWKAGAINSFINLIMMITLILEWSVARAVTKSDLDQFPKFYEPSSNSRKGNKTLPISLLANFILSPKRIKLDHSHFSALIISLPHWRQKDISWPRVFCSILFYFPTITNVFDVMCSL